MTEDQNYPKSRFGESQNHDFVDFEEFFLT